MADQVSADQKTAERVRFTHDLCAGLCPVCELPLIGLSPAGVSPRGGPDRRAFERKKRLVLQALESTD